MVKVVKTDADTYTVHIEGDLDEANSEPLRKELDKLIAVRPAQIVFDMSGLEFMNSTGVGVLLSRYKKAAVNDTEFWVKNLSKQAEKLFRVSGLFRIIKQA